MLDSPPEQADNLPQPIPRRYYVPGERLADAAAPDEVAGDGAAFRSRSRWRYVAAFALYVVLGALLATAGASAASLLTSYRQHSPTTVGGGDPAANGSAKTWTSTEQPWEGPTPTGIPSPTPARASLLGPSPLSTATPPPVSSGIEATPTARPKPTPTPAPVSTPTPTPTPTPKPTPTTSPTPAPTPTPKA